MKFKVLIGVGIVGATILKFTVFPDAQGADVKADYDRANSLTNRVANKIYNNVDTLTPANWIPGTAKFWYRKSAKGGANAGSFVLVDPVVPSKAPAFDHARLATSLSTAASGTYTATTLPFTTFTYADNMQAIDFTIGGGAGRAGGGGGGRDAGAAAADAGQPAAPRWHCTLTDYTCTRSTAPVETVAGGFGAGQGRAGGGGRGGGCANVTGGQAGRAGGGAGGGGRAGGGAAAEETPTCRSFDGKYDAFIQNYNVFIRPVPAADGGGGHAGGRGANAPQPVALSWDGSEGDAYTFNSIAWSPDSKHIAAYRRLPGYNRLVTYVQSSPSDQLQPKTSTMFYRKPGDVVDLDKPALFDVDTRQQHIIDRTLFPNAFNISGPSWRRDSRGFTFNYNQRGHQVYRVIEVDANTAKPRAVIEETSKTFITYSNLTSALGSAGRMSKSEINDGKEIIWMSERDGWAHLYLYDGITGQVKNQITKGPWVVRSVERVDEANRQIYFTAGGMIPGKDPYLLHYYRINFDGTGLVTYTQGDGYHDQFTWSPDRQYYVTRYSRVDMPPVVELRRASDQKVVMELERADITDLLATGWKPPEVFTAKGRDGTTDIWGIIIRPTNFDPAKKYPVIENIYAGPQGSFVPKTFSTQGGMQTLAELGFIVVQIDGMGTANRSKAFHDYAWKNIGDAGFPDRILWHKAVGAKYAYYDTTRVGIYGTSAGGQNSTGAVLFHPEFYKAAASSAGCHDNRMDKIWWNEQWMGWPIGPEYAASSNMEHAANLKGALFLLVGEMDNNVDPSSTMQVVNKLILANKNFDLLVIPNALHTNGGAYGDHKRFDFFVYNLQGRMPPPWNSSEAISPNSISVLDADAIEWEKTEDLGVSNPDGQ